MLLALVCLPLFLVLPEVGVPLMLVALRLMASRFRWAARASDGLERKRNELHKWFAHKPRPIRWLLLGALAMVVILLVVLAGYELLAS
ncbi:hypothetical protein ACFQ7F_10180 [Streptomyces sp. NPDC056486]|uniref:hypothetical protein n=1 Tax=Streptomyces sp. NPDC056486 TaxID=3345835 RepID=UPI0036ADB79A